MLPDDQRCHFQFKKRSRKEGKPVYYRSQETAEQLSSEFLREGPQIFYFFIDISNGFIKIKKKIQLHLKNAPLYQPKITIKTASKKSVICNHS